MGYIPIMPYSRIIPILAVAISLPLLAAAQEPAPQPTPAAAIPPNDSTKFCKNVLSSSIIRLRLRPRIAAKIVEDVDMLNQKFSLEGKYYKDAGLRIRFELNLKGLGDANSTMLQVSDGKVLWEFNKVLNMQSYRRRDIVPILDRLKDPNLDDTFRMLIKTQLGFGGPEALLEGFMAKVAFDQFADEAVDGVQSYILGGTWVDRTGLMSLNDRPLAPTAPLPSYIPSNIRVFVDKETLWPYRIEMVGKAASMLQEDIRKIGPDGRPEGLKKPAPKVDPSRITLRYTLLPEDPADFDKQFIWQPPREAASLVEDDTEKFLAQLDQFIQIQINQKKAEAAKSEGDQPLLKTPIEPSLNPGGPEPPAPK